MVGEVMVNGTSICSFTFFSDFVCFLCVFFFLIEVIWSPVHALNQVIFAPPIFKLSYYDFPHFLSHLLYIYSHQLLC